MNLNLEEKEVKDIRYKIIITNPIEYIIVTEKVKKLNQWTTKQTKKYLTANLWYGATGSKTDIELRQQIKEKCTFFLYNYVKNCPVFTKFPLRITYTYYHHKESFDIQNKLYFWAKLFDDYIVKRKRIPDDNVQFIKQEHYNFERSDEHKLIIEIESI